jgi:hypothetical protein
MQYAISTRNAVAYFCAKYGTVRAKSLDEEPAISDSRVSNAFRILCSTIRSNQQHRTNKRPQTVLLPIEE